MAKFFKILFLIIVGLLILLALAVWIGTPKINKKIELTLQHKLQEAGFHAKAITVNIWQRGVDFDSIYYTAPSDTIQTPAHIVSLSTLSIHGLHIFALWKKKRLIVDDITVADGILRYNKRYNLTIDAGSTTQNQSLDIRSIEVKKLSIQNIQTAVLNDTLVETSGNLHSLAVSEAAMVLGKDTTYAVASVAVDIRDLMQSKKDALHRISAYRVQYSSDNNHLEADSFRITPNYNKLQFARVAKIQKTRLDILLPRVVAEGIEQTRFFSDTTLAISRITLPDATVHAYRNKQYPFVRDWIMPMPIDGIRRLPFKLKIDSIYINNANIAYEELSEKGLNESGTITFNSLSATFAGISTESKKPDTKTFATLVADCKVMNSGDLHAVFKLPLNNTINYEATGSVKNMDLTSLNPALGNLTRISIQSGLLKDLRFNFSYNNNVSTGEVLINYEQLKLQAFKKDKDHEVNKIFSAAINAIIKSDKDKTVDKSKRTGVINIERDKKRFIFQFWWKSLLDGLQSTFLSTNKNDRKKKSEPEKVKSGK